MRRLTQCGACKGTGRRCQAFLQPASFSPATIRGTFAGEYAQRRRHDDELILFLVISLTSAIALSLLPRRHGFERHDAGSLRLPKDRRLMNEIDMPLSFHGSD